jgi:hypothetical protein
MLDRLQVSQGTSRQDSTVDVRLDAINAVTVSINALTEDGPDGAMVARSKRRNLVVTQADPAKPIDAGRAYP